DAQGVTVIDILPAGLSYSSSSAGGAQGNTFADQIATLAAGQSTTITLTALVASSVADGTQVTNTASVTAGTTDPTPANNSAAAPVTVSAKADVAVSFASAPATAVAGGSIIYTIAVTNTGPSD